MYVIKEANGEVIGYASRLEDAEAMCQRTGKENKKYSNLCSWFKFNILHIYIFMINLK